MAKRKARIKAYAHYIAEIYSPLEWELKLQSVEGHCQKCGKQVGINNLECDHIYPKNQAKKIFAETGKRVVYGIDDIRPVCRPCNIHSKHSAIEI